jgi:hypothetical protein
MIDKDIPTNGLHRCNLCNKHWVHVRCQAKDRPMMPCPQCDGYTNSAKPWEYLDDFDSWVLDARNPQS